MYFNGATREEAQDEIDYRIEYEDDEALESHRVEEVPEGLKGTPELAQQARYHRSKDFMGDIVLELAATLYAEHVLKIDGVWWNDIYDPDSLSAPRGMIVPSMIPTWTIER